MNFSFTETYFHLSPQKPMSPVIKTSATDFLNEDKVSLLLNTYGTLKEATDGKLPASFIGVTLCNLCISQLIFVAQSQQFLDLSLGNLTFYIESSENHHSLGYSINKVNGIPVPKQDWEKFLQQSWMDWIEKDIRPAIETIAQSADVKPTLIWNQFGGHLTQMKDIFLKGEDSQDVKDRLNATYYVLTELLPPEVFGLRKNPFKHKPRYIENPYNPEETWMIRSSCCMWDQRKNGEKCYTCPRLTPAQRDEMKKDLLKIQNEN